MKIVQRLLSGVRQILKAVINFVIGPFVELPRLLSRGWWEIFVILLQCAARILFIASFFAPVSAALLGMAQVMLLVEILLLVLTLLAVLLISLMGVSSYEEKMQQAAA